MPLLIGNDIEFKITYSSGRGRKASTPAPIKERLTRLEYETREKLARSATRRGMTIVKNAAIANAKAIDDPATAEAIYKNIVVQESKRRGRALNAIVMRVGVKGGARKYSDSRENRRKGRVGKTYKTLGDSGNPGGDTWYWRFIELGTEKIAARPFMSNALRDNAQAAIDVTAKSLSDGIDKTLKKLGA